MTDSFSRVAMLLVIVVLFFAWIMKPTENVVQVESPSPKMSQEEASAGRRYFMKECDVEPGFTNYCNCTYDHLISTRSVEEISSMATATEAEVEVIIQPSVDYCLDKLL